MMFNSLMLYIISIDKMFTVYQLQEINAVLILVSIIIYVLMQNKITKYILSIILSTVIVLNYVIYYLVTSYEIIKLYPFIVMEISHSGYSSISFDVGQIAIVALIMLWRKELRNILSKLCNR